MAKIDFSQTGVSLLQEVIRYSDSQEAVAAAKKELKRRTIEIKMSPESDISGLTKAVRAENEFTRNILTVTQCWTWDGGDAIVLLGPSEIFKTSETFVVIRMGTDVRVLNVKGVRQALETFDTHSVFVD